MITAEELRKELLKREALLFERKHGKDVAYFWGSGKDRIKVLKNGKKVKV